MDDARMNNNKRLMLTIFFWGWPIVFVGLSLVGLFVDNGTEYGRQLHYKLVWSSYVIALLSAFIIETIMLLALH